MFGVSYGLKCFKTPYEAVKTTPHKSTIIYYRFHLIVFFLLIVLQVFGIPSQSSRHEAVHAHAAAIEKKNPHVQRIELCIYSYLYRTYLP